MTGGPVAAGLQAYYDIANLPVLNALIFDRKWRVKIPAARSEMEALRSCGIFSLPG